jgi:hypothetical protein
MPDVQVFLPLEARMVRAAEQAVLDFIEPQLRDLAEAADAGDLIRSSRIVEQLDFSGIEKARGMLELVGLNAVLLGAAQVVEGRETRLTRFVRDREIPPEVAQGVDQMIQVMTTTGADLVRGAAQKVLVQAEAEEPTIGGIGVSAGPIRVRKQEDLAARLNAAVKAGVKVQSSVGANLTTSRLMQFGHLAQATAGGLKTFQWNSILDSKTCPFCRGMHGKTFQVAPAMAEMRTILTSQDPEVARQLSPWPNQSIASINRLAGMSNEKLQEEGFAKPPAHPRCRCVLSIVGTVPKREIKGFKLRPPPSAARLLVEEEAEAVRQPGAVNVGLRTPEER